MPNTRQVQRRITTVKNIQQITHAMELVASARLRRAQERAEASRPYVKEITACLGRLRKDNPTLDHPLLAGRATRDRTLIVLLSTNRGLCGGYNVKLLQKAAEVAAAEPAKCAYLVVGKRGRDALAKTGEAIIADFSEFEGIPTYREAERVTRTAVEAFLNDTCDRVVLVYTRFQSALKQIPQSKRLLPVGAETDEPTPSTAVFYEPALNTVVERLVSEYVTTTVFQAMADAFASEFAARRLAMQSATENAGDVIQRLTLQFNRARQSAITQELSEIVGGASALK